MARVIVNEDRCKGCGLCTTVCPKKIMELDKNTINIKGYHPSKCIDMDECIGCAFCATICPDVCITVEK